ncbi:homogentisate 1,2-dioxygenase [Polytolypa hystricis UAMH7299]|uniref:homogentisate 1,2-dioxygenase n=1 Tax=Polytolypa hystricis (strain UAMH7299) TaxID=1447883 RepID=A0A2B7Y9W6_POLH7|nr:homogentisate 1,2-dioxygenase [Polytolypa hystricis UAMH7299]
MPVTTFSTPEKYTYLNGFGSYHETEALPGALPIGQNSPQKPPFGLYAEKLSGTAFTAPRHENKQSWLYRILPSAAHSNFTEVDPSTYHTNLSRDANSLRQIPNQLRWNPFDLDLDVDWVRGLHLVAGAGDPTTKTGLGILLYAAGRDMGDEAFYSADGDFLIVPQHGVLDIQTELGRLFVRPNEICVIPRGIRYRVTLPDGPVRGYICELYQGHFQLPELGPIGSNCLANARDFQAPTAHFEDDDDESAKTYHLISKFNNVLFTASQPHNPFNVIAWHGTYYPYKYDLGRFNTIGSISYDHPDPSIFTVLTSPSPYPGTAVADFVIFPPRWLVAENTFRPPWYHRNTMSEFMGLVAGDYDAKVGGGFRPAGASLHNVMSAHGPDGKTHEVASNVVLGPKKVGEGSLAFMFESSMMVGVSEWGLKTCQKVQEDYNEESWTPLKRHFVNPNKQK